MKKWATKNGYGKPKPRFCMINMASCHAGKDGIMRAMLKKIASAIEISKDAKLQEFEKKFKKQSVVLILDEIDMLFQQHGGIADTWFRTLVEWAEDKEMRFSMIGISNCVNDASAIRVRELGHVSSTLVACDIISFSP